MLPTAPPFPPLDNFQYPNQMDHFNDYTGSYPISSAREEFDVYRFPDQTTTTGEPGYRENPSTFPDFWETLEQPGPTVSLPTILPATSGHESLALATSWADQPDGYDQPSSSGYYWPEVGQEARSYYSGSLSQEYCFPGTAESKPPTVNPTFDSAIPLDYWRDSQSGPSTSMFYMGNVDTYHQPSTSSTRAELMSARRYQPYRRSRAQGNEHRNAEAGPSTLAPPPTSYVGLPTLQPSGGVISEPTADAENAQTMTEEDKVPESKRAKRPPGEGPPRPYRIRVKEDTTKLLDWARRRLGLREAPVYNVALAEAVGVIPTIRSPVYAKSRLRTGKCARTSTDSKSANGERERRKAERGFFHELSKYYPLRQGQSFWTRPPLLSRVVKDLEGIPPPPGPSDQPPP